LIGQGLISLDIVNAEADLGARGGDLFEELSSLGAVFAAILRAKEEKLNRLLQLSEGFGNLLDDVIVEEFVHEGS